MTLILVFAASPFDAHHGRGSANSKPESLLVVPLGKAISGIPHFGVVDKWLTTPKAMVPPRIFPLFSVKIIGIFLVELNFIPLLCVILCQIIFAEYSNAWWKILNVLIGKFWWNRCWKITIF